MATAADADPAASIGRASRPRGACEWSNKIFEIIRSGIETESTSNTADADGSSEAAKGVIVEGRPGRAVRLLRLHGMQTPTRNFTRCRRDDPQRSAMVRDGVR